ncbi:MAG: SDR family oxidoreductase, partial [Bacteroidia bacterium]|nr:SDR family oxidoreductase [Bacteroidia bacterium]
CLKLITETVNHFNRIDVLINNAGISMRALLKNCNLDVLRQLMDTNFWGTVYCTKFALPFILKTKGSIVGISSIAGIKGLPGRTGYSASKFAMHGFLESLRIENLKTGLHVLVACPGYTASNIRNTALNDQGKSQSESPLDESKLMQPEEVADKVFSAIRKRKRYIFLSFEGKVTNILNKFFSAWLDKLVYNKVSSEKDSPFK